MKVIFMLVLALTCIYGETLFCDKVSATSAETGQARGASKDVKEAIQKAKEAAKSKKDCPQNCVTIYKPICVYDPANVNYKPRTFGSQCVLDNHNCQMGTKLAVKTIGECPGSTGVKLS